MTSTSAITGKPIIYHIPICPFSQRLEIMLEMKGLRDAVEFRVVDITIPRAPELLAKTKGRTAMPFLELPDGRCLGESLVILDYLDQTLGQGSIRRDDPWERAIEASFARLEAPLVSAGYGMILNQDRAKTQGFIDRLLKTYGEMDAILSDQNPGGDFLFDRFGYAECVMTPMFMRFWFLDYYEDFPWPSDGLQRMQHWRKACLASPLAQQTSEEEVIKLYYDYALGIGNGGLLPGRQRSTFVFEPHWRDRPMPPRAKYGPSASDEVLGLLA